MGEGTGTDSPVGTLVFEEGPVFSFEAVVALVNFLRKLYDDIISDVGMFS